MKKMKLTLNQETIRNLTSQGADGRNLVITVTERSICGSVCRTC